MTPFILSGNIITRAPEDGSRDPIHLVFFLSGGTDWIHNMNLKAGEKKCIKLDIFSLDSGFLQTNKSDMHQMHP